ncbi:hypothetical protein [Oricola cellulosilytica]|uniref:Uncharacterized protein n=1 Tax=Oricola cellulosilytica TaxID=1429082 RepID=A0A4R0PFB8_9HYPH|nr:hypothetical protein [Oricola cellulosilytica]TCD16526.1 hypothetical protein E0D97_03650 [Oricola cellulosilytica]
MGFDWEGSVEHYGDALDALAARLVTMAGILWGRPVETLPRRLYLEILAILRPAEFALRRLIVMAAWKVVPFTEFATANQGSEPEGKAGKAGAMHPVSPLAGEMSQRDRGGDFEQGAMEEIDKPRPFPIFDPWKRYGPPFLTEEQIAALNDPHRVPLPPRPVLDPDEPVPAKTLCRRVRAFANALLNLDHHIDRMARWRARCHLDSTRPRRWWPIRPGVPPGFSERPKTLVGGTLKDCHILALDALNSS